jgi:hypothetical protein
MGAKRMPVSVVWFSSATINTLRRPEDINIDNRMSYTFQLLIGRKFGNALSFQLTPTLVHRNLVLTSEDKNDIFALGFGGRYKITNRVALNAEYFYRFNANEDNMTYNAIAIGVDIETGGHVFQLHFTNAQSMVESGFIPGTSSRLTAFSVNVKSLKSDPSTSSVFDGATFSAPASCGAQAESNPARTNITSIQLLILFMTSLL